MSYSPDRRPAATADAERDARNSIRSRRGCSFQERGLRSRTTRSGSWESFRNGPVPSIAADPPSSVPAAAVTGRGTGVDRTLGPILLAAIVGGMFESLIESGVLSAGGLFAFPFWMAVALAHRGPDADGRRDLGQQGVAQGMTQRHPGRRQPLRPRRADVVLAHGLDEVPADHPGIERGRRHRQRDPRKDEVALGDRLPDVGVDLEAR